MGNGVAVLMTDAELKAFALAVGQRQLEGLEFLSVVEDIEDDGVDFDPGEVFDQVLRMKVVFDD